MFPNGTGIPMFFMKNLYLKRLSLLFFLLLGSLIGFGQTLSAGDLAIIGVGVDDEEILIVALNNIPSGESVFFTDDEWNVSSFNSGEGFYEWVTPVISAGTVFTLSPTTSSAGGTVTQRAGSFALSNSGDGVFLYQTSTNLYNSGSYTLLGFAGEDAGDAGTLSGSGLTLGTNAIYFGGDNGIYTGARSANSISGHLSNIYDNSNWTTSGSSQIFDLTSFVVSNPQITENLTGFSGSFGTVNVGSNSSSSSFSVQGSNLTADITITPPTGFEVSLDDANWFSSRTLTQTGGTVSSTTVYIRFSPGSAGFASGNVVLSSAGATDVNIPVDGTGTNPNDADTEVYEPITQVAAKTIIAADVTTLGTATDVFAFEIEDQGTSDGLNTLVTQVRVVPGANNTADWTDFIQGVRLHDGSGFVTIGSATISDTEIIIPISSGDLVITDNTSSVITLYVYLNTSNITDGQVLDFSIPATGSDFVADLSGSGFNPTFTLGSIEGNDITVDVDYTAIAFVQQPSNANVNAAMSPAVTVEAIDANGNRDIDYNLNIEITSSGTLTGSPVTEAAVSGLATFSSLTHTATGTGLTLTADDGLVSSISSNSFDITTAPIPPTVGDVYITEIVDANSDFNAEYLELYNNTGNEIDLSTSKLIRMSASGTFEYVYDFGVDETSGVETDLTIPAYGFLIVARGATRAEFNTEYSITLDAGVSYNGGNSNNFFGTGRRWSLRTGGTADTDDGTLIDDTDGGVGTNRDIQIIFSGVFSTSGDYNDANPGELDYAVYNGGSWVNSTTPTASTDAYIYDNWTINSNTEVQVLGINTDDTVFVTPTNSLAINGDFTNNGHLLLQADNTGYSQMKLDGSYAGSGVVAQQQYTNVEGWHPIGSPFASAEIDSLGDQENTYGNLFYWDAAAYNYVAPSGQFEAGRGYIAYFGANGVSSDAMGPWTFELEGTPNTSVTPTLTYNTSGTWNSFNNGNPNNDGWNLIANPFSCNLDFSTLSLSNVENAFYKYNENNNSWRSYAPAGATPSEIAPLQGFWVRATNGGTPSVGTLTPSANGTTSNPANFFKQSLNRIVLNVDANGNSDQLTFALVNSSTEGFDSNWDAWKMQNGSGVPNLYSHFGNEDLSINAVPLPSAQQSAHTVGIRCDSTGSFTISMDPSFWDSSSPFEVWLYDQKTDLEHNLLNGDYTFTHDTTFTELRFELRIRDPFVHLVEEEANEFTVRYGEEYWSIDGISSVGCNFALRNSQGQIVRRGMLNAEENRIANQNVSSGVYFIELITENGSTFLKAIK